MQRLSNQEKAILYNDMLRRYQLLQEEVRKIKAQDINVSEPNQRKIDEIEKKMQRIYNDTQKLYK